MNECGLLVIKVQRHLKSPPQLIDLNNSIALKKMIRLERSNSHLSWLVSGNSYVIVM